MPAISQRHHLSPLFPFETRQGTDSPTQTRSRRPLQSMSYAGPTLPLKYLTRLLVKKMASQSDHHYALEDKEGRDLTHRMLLDEQQRRIESRNMIEASYRSPICPYYTISGHTTCWYCHQNAIPRPLTSTDILLRNLSRPQTQVCSSPHLNPTSH